MLGIESLKDVRDRLVEVGHELSELAKKVQSKNVDAMAVVQELYDAFNAMDNAFRGMKHIVRGHLVRVGIDPRDVNVEATTDAIESARNAVAALYGSVLKPLHGLETVDVEIDSRDVSRYLDELDVHVYRLTGRHCVKDQSNKLSSVLQSLASCVHAIAEHLSNIKVVGKCAVLEESEKGRKFCLTWSKAAEENRRAGRYEVNDYYNLEGWVVDDRVHLRLGMDEIAIVDLDAGTLDYWDKDERVSKVLKDVLEEYAGLHCTLLRNNISCRGVSDKNMDKVALALSMATSMDDRLDNPYAGWEPEYAELGEKTAAIKWLKELEKKV